MEQYEELHPYQHLAYITMAMDHAYRKPIMQDIGEIMIFLAYGALWWWMVGQLHKDQGEKGSEMSGMNALMKSGIGLRDFYLHGILFALRYEFLGVLSDEVGEANPVMQNAGRSRKAHASGNRVEDTVADTAMWTLVKTITKGGYERKKFFEPNKFHLKDVIIDQQIFGVSVSSLHFPAVVCHFTTFSQHHRFRTWEPYVDWS